MRTKLRDLAQVRLSGYILGRSYARRMRRHTTRYSMRLLPLLALFLLLAACELKETPDTASQPAEDVAAAADVAAEPTADTAAEAPDVGPELPVYPAVTFNKRPWLQWPTAESVTLLAETAEETPLDVVMTHAGGSFHLYTEPTRPTFQFLGMELEGLDGWFHQVDIPVPEGVGAFTVSVANADYIREVTLPQSLDSFTMIAFGDTRTHHDIHQQVADQVAAEKALVVFQTGDLMDSALELAQWNQFFQIEAKALQESFYFPIFGNHEIGGEDYYYTLFETRNSFGSERNWWLDLGQVGIIGIEQYATDWNDPEALVWLEAVLSQLQDKRWLIFAHHEPMYTFSNHGPCWSSTASTSSSPATTIATSGSRSTASPTSSPAAAAPPSTPPVPVPTRRWTWCRAGASSTTTCASKSPPTSSPSPSSIPRTAPPSIFLSCSAVPLSPPVIPRAPRVLGLAEVATPKTCASGLRVGERHVLRKVAQAACFSAVTV
jgi:hypothetical protein